MAKRRKNPIDLDFGNAVNATEDLKQQIVLDCEVYDGEGDPRVGIMVLHTLAGHYQFIVGEASANELIQQLRDFIAEDAEQLP